MRWFSTPLSAEAGTSVSPMTRPSPSMTVARGTAESCATQAATSSGCGTGELAGERAPCLSGERIALDVAHAVADVHASSMAAAGASTATTTTRKATSSRC